MGLLRYTAWRCLQAIPVLIGIVTITFFLTNAIPGDPVSIMLGPTPSAEMVEQVQARYGLNQPLHERYFSYLAGVAQGDLGHSIYYDVPVLTKIIERLPVTAYLVFSAFGFALLTAIPLGVISAKRRNEPVDHVSRIVALIGVSTPSFWIGLLLIILFSFQLGLLPATGLFLPWADPANVRGAVTQLDVVVESLKRLVMPMVALGTLQMASITRIERSSMVDSLQNEYVKLARAYGVDERGVVWKHAFKPAQLPVITIVGLGLSTALGGAVLIETVFEINGMGRLVIQAINNQDYPLVMGTTFMLGALYLVGVIITDISYAYIDPRVTYGEK
ncbi:ABC transporter permease [Halalkalicoccus jeotgali]|uniref:Binding-protein-dependent transport systems inner membrane component n=1 Tax=Halalkalicoccus jeotgali (strain DSM 18796 / CECT 7217 / JCM 14584 / KCTC 4019 / B3) TaxID=795797 RepID=D8J573_HALJB|nr:ABC transporter permease [Halalkalicoccus jeotgali]ADJ13654.1 binding-protein-dependent transport systems inner membrane component [Halalkalicoccus jeotgali B3]ELY34299.1 binding-protein-dependent transport systems inner membrane component [Halalkalicoccus jeotgali B3]